jgi:hypothetical protein
MGAAMTDSRTQGLEEALLEKLGLKPGMPFEFHQIDVSETAMQYILATFKEEKLLREDTTYDIFTPLNADDTAQVLLKYKRKPQQNRS